MTHHVLYLFPVNYPTFNKQVDFSITVSMIVMIHLNLQEKLINFKNLIYFCWSLGEVLEKLRRKGDIIKVLVRRKNLLIRVRILCRQARNRRRLLTDCVRKIHPDLNLNMIFMEIDQVSTQPKPKESR